VIGSTTALAERSTETTAFLQGRAWPGVCYIACIVGRILRRGLSFALAAALVGACAAPTLPLPPPAIPNISFSGLPKGQVQLSGGPGSVLANAEVIITNESTRLPAAERVEATLADGAGAWSKVIFANHGDFVDIVQLESTELSSPQTVQIP
jgi:hypothetical protein